MGGFRILHAVKIFAMHLSLTLSFAGLSSKRRVATLICVLPHTCIVCRAVSQIYSAAGDGTDGYSCRLYAYLGTSMSCPIVAGAAAMVSSRSMPYRVVVIGTFKGAGSKRRA